MNPTTPTPDESSTKPKSEVTPCAHGQATPIRASNAAAGESHPPSVAAKTIDELAGKPAGSFAAHVLANPDPAREDSPRLAKVLKEIADYPLQPIWSDDRDDAADAMVELAEQALAAGEGK